MDAQRLFEEIALTIHDKVRLKVRAEGKRRPIREAEVGDDFTHATGRWSRREMIVDRENNLYRERVTDKETGLVIHSCEERLSEHRGHGDARGHPRED